MATVYTKTDNYGLNLYGDNDPADLRDGYNGSMRTIDTTLETHLNRIEGVEAREVHDEAVMKALLADNTVDNATAAKTKWDKAGTDAAAAASKANTNAAILTALGADTTAHATAAKTKWDKAGTDATTAIGKTDANAAILTALGADNADNAQQLNQLINTNTSNISKLESWKSEVESWRTADFKPKNIWTKTADGVHGLRIDISAYVLPATGQVVIASGSDGANLTSPWSMNESVTLGTIPAQYAPTRTFETFAFLNTETNIEMVLGIDASGNVYAKNGRTQLAPEQRIGSYNAEITYLAGVGL